MDYSAYCGMVGKRNGILVAIREIEDLEASIQQAEDGA